MYIYLSIYLYIYIYIYIYIMYINSGVGKIKNYIFDNFKIHGRLRSAGE